MRHHVSSDLDALQVQKRALATDVVKALGAVMQHGKLGSFLTLLKLEDDSVRLAYLQTERELADDGKPAATVQATVVSDDLGEELSQLLGLEPVVSIVAGNDPARPNERDFATVFATNLVQTWLDTIVEQSKNQRAMEYHCVSAGLLVELARELEVAAQKTGLYKRMIDAVRITRGFRTSGNGYMWRQVAPVASQFNTFIDYAGHQISSEDGVAVISLADKRLSIFARRPSTDPLSCLSETSTRFEQKYFVDWIQGVQSAIRSNAEFLAGIEGDSTSNTRLGEILQQLKDVEHSQHLMKAT